MMMMSIHTQNTEKYVVYVFKKRAKMLKAIVKYFFSYNII